MKFQATCIAAALTAALFSTPSWSNEKGEEVKQEVAASDAVEASDDAKQDNKKWDVNNPPGEEKVITIDTDEITWSNVDVSPDGKSIVFDMLGDIYTMSIKGGVAKPLTQGMSWSMQPRFSPDGKQIAYISDESGADNLWVMNVDGTEPKQVSQEKVNLVHTPNWSPDGEYIAVKKGFVSARSIAAGEIWLFHKAGGNGFQIKKRIGGENAQKTIAEPAFTPDGRYIYYSMDSTPGTRWEYNKNPTTEIFSIRRYDRETGKDIKIAGGPGGAIAPTPSSDGKHLAFVRRVDDKTVLFVKDLKTGLEKPLFDGLDRDLQETNGSQGNFVHFDWTPDNKSLVFWAQGKIHKINANNGKLETLPLQVKVEKKITEALRFDVDVNPHNLDSPRRNARRFCLKQIRFANHGDTEARRRILDTFLRHRSETSRHQRVFSELLR